MIRTEGLTKYYGSRCAVRKLDLHIADREIVGFLGLNGAGKTTTLKMLAGLLAPSEGTITIDGERLEAHATGRVRWDIGFLPERPPVYDDMNVRGYLSFAAQLHGVPAGDAPRRVGEVIELCDLQDYSDAPISSLSHGFKKRVGIAQAVVHDPALVILDEPISGLDPVQIRHMRELIRNLKDKHTVLLSSHNLPEIHETCDRLMVIVDGKLAHSGTEAELSAEAEGAPRTEVEVAQDSAALQKLLSAAQTAKTITGFDALQTQDGRAVALVHAPPAVVAKLLVEAGMDLHRLEPQSRELGSLFEELTRSAS